jgi:hypothetical protein
LSVWEGHCFTLRKTQPERFWLLCVVGMSQLPWWKKWAFVSFGLQKKEIH